MSDPTDNPAPADSAPPSPPATPPANTPAAGGDQPWYNALPEQLRADPGIARYKSLEDFTKAKLNLDKHFGVPEDQLVRLPKADDADAMAALYAKLGRPEKADGYKLPGAEGLPALAPEIEAKARETFHKLGLSTQQAEALWTLQNEVALQTQKDAADALEAQNAAAVGELQKAWGQQYDGRVRQTQDYIKETASPELVKFLDETGLATNPHLYRLVGDLVAAAQPRRDLPGAGGGGGLQPAGSLTPVEAKAEMNRLSGDVDFQKALTDQGHPGHANAVKRWTDLAAVQAQANKAA